MVCKIQDGRHFANFANNDFLTFGFISVFHSADALQSHDYE
jgi:hypothetical protein